MIRDTRWDRIRRVGGLLLIVGLVALIGLTGGPGGHGAEDWSRPVAWWREGHAVHAGLRPGAISLPGAAAWVCIRPPRLSGS